MDTKKDINQLNSFLRGELAAVETYIQAIERVGREDPIVASELDTCRQSHQRRVMALSEEVRRLGGNPSNSSGVWGGFAKLVEGGAKAFGKSAAIKALEQGEDHGRDDYKRGLSDLDPMERSFVEIQLLPEQLRTHEVVSRLSHRL